MIEIKQRVTSLTSNNARDFVMMCKEKFISLKGGSVKSVRFEIWSRTKSHYSTRVS